MHIQDDETSYERNTHVICGYFPRDELEWSKWTRVGLSHIAKLEALLHLFKDIDLQTSIHLCLTRASPARTKPVPIR